MNSQAELFFVGFWEDSFLKDVVLEISQKEQNKVLISVENYLNVNSRCNDHFDFFKIYYCRREKTISEAFGGFSPAILDEDILNKFYECKSYFMRTIDRVFIEPRSVRENESYFNELLSFYLSFFENHKNLRAVVFSSVPHFPWDIVIFFVAQYIGVDKIILRRTLIDDCVVLDSDFRKNFGEIVCYDENEFFLKKIDNIFDSDDSFWLRMSKNINKNNKSSYFSSIIIQFIFYLPWLFLTFVRSYKSYTKGYMILHPCNYLKLLFIYKIKLLFLRKWIENNAISINSSDHFVYFALHFQPERSTDPEAGEFSHQYVAIKLLSEVIPHGWKIFVKEHPRQVSSHPDVRKLHYRSVMDYQKISSIPNVNIVHTSYTSGELIEKCKMTASCTGSIVWEGLLRGKAGITFGRVWHSQCKSSIFVSNIDDASRAVNILTKKNKIEIFDDVVDFLNDYSNCMILSSNCENAASSSPVPRNILVSNLVSAIINALSVRSKKVR